MPVSAKIGGHEDVTNDESIGISELIEELQKLTYLPSRDPNGPFVFAVDHCFSIKGQGTVMTGTVLSGSIQVNSNIEIAALKEVRKVKSIQIFRKAANHALQGDRAGLCVTQFDASLLERGLISTPGILPNANAMVISLKKIRFFKQDISSGSKFHVSIGHSTVLSTVTLFTKEMVEDFDFNHEYAFLSTLSDLQADKETHNQVFALLEFEHPVVIAPNSKVLGSRLDTDVHTTSCRLAFEGHTQVLMPTSEVVDNYKIRLKVFKLKEKCGLIERANNDMELIGKNMFKKETNIHVFDGFKVALSNGAVGRMDGPFGQSGKFKVRLEEPLNDEWKTILSSGSSKKKKNGGGSDEHSKPTSSSMEVKMVFKKFIFSKTMAQS